MVCQSWRYAERSGCRREKEAIILFALLAKKSMINYIDSQFTKYNLSF